MKKQKLLTGAKLTKALDNLVREILKLKYPEGRCFVSGNVYGWFHPQKNPRGCQVGHYISRRIYTLRWDLLNVFPQGAKENREHQFNTLPFTSRIIQVHGNKRIEYLDNVYKKYKAQGGMSLTEKRLLHLSLIDYKDKLQAA
jgi:hypothetical protein